MIDQLQLIKPKKIKETYQAILLPNHIVLEFGTTKVIVPCVTNFHTCKINQKDLYSYEYDNAVQIKKYDLPKLDKGWEECIINTNDVSVFSAYSASGDDEYFIGRIQVDNRLKLDLYGFTYHAEYEAHKLRTETSFSYNVDYHVFYYLFQMFKQLSGKKTDKLLWRVDDTNLILTNEARSFYILCSQDDAAYKFKTKNLSLLVDFYKKETKGEKQVFKKTTAETVGSIAKHLIRPLDDVIKLSENDMFIKMIGSGYTLCLNKKKN